jgi:hypothetical protein
MADYTLLPGGAVLRKVDGALIPDDPGNRDRQSYALWLAAGHTADPTPTPATTVPAQITRRQFILSLMAAGLITDGDGLAWAQHNTIPPAFDVVLDNLPEADALEARVTLLTMGVAERGSPLIGAVIALGLATADQADAVFIFGASL